MSNNILVITSNPEKDSMTDAVGAAFAAGAVERGASADVLDLYDEGFNPVYSAADRAHYLGHAPMPEDVVPIQRRLAQADVIALVFPIYWYTMPAMVKGPRDLPRVRLSSGRHPRRARGQDGAGHHADRRLAAMV